MHAIEMPSGSFDNSTKRSGFERPRCPLCRQPMSMSKICGAIVGQRKPKFDREVRFECLACGHFEIVATPVDPLHSDAIGWIASELRPPK
jgi:hypothetical protein